MQPRFTDPLPRFLAGPSDSCKRLWAHQGSIWPARFPQMKTPAYDIKDPVFDVIVEALRMGEGDRVVGAAGD